MNCYLSRIRPTLQVVGESGLKVIVADIFEWSLNEVETKLDVSVILIWWS
jgi:hypothetical protein